VTGTVLCTDADIAASTVARAYRGDDDEGDDHRDRGHDDDGEDREDDDDD
jgi:hypothetical protein